MFILEICKSLVHGMVAVATITLPALAYSEITHPIALNGYTKLALVKGDRFAPIAGTWSGEINCDNDALRFNFQAFMQEDGVGINIMKMEKSTFKYSVTSEYSEGDIVKFIGNSWASDDDGTAPITHWKMEASGSLSIVKNGCTGHLANH